MYPVSDAFLTVVNSSNTRKYRWTETITTTVGKTYEFENKDIVQGSGYNELATQEYMDAF